jgi:hypothetical protein
MGQKLVRATWRREEWVRQMGATRTRMAGAMTHLVAPAEVDDRLVQHEEVELFALRSR